MKLARNHGQSQRNEFFQKMAENNHNIFTTNGDNETIDIFNHEMIESEFCFSCI